MSKTARLKESVMCEQKKTSSVDFRSAGCKASIVHMEYEITMKGKTFWNIPRCLALYDLPCRPRLAIDTTKQYTRSIRFPGTFEKVSPQLNKHRGGEGGGGGAPYGCAAPLWMEST